MEVREKRKELSDYCNWQGDGDQCDGCVLNCKVFSCAFNSAPDEEINKMYERYMEGY